MTRYRMTWLGRAATVVLGLALAAGLVRASSNTKYTDALNGLRKQWAAEQQKLGLNPLDSKSREKLYKEHPSPEITLCKVVEVQPDGSAVVEMSGKFPDGTTFLADNDAVDLVSPSVTGGQFKATVKAAPGQGPGFVNIHAYSPVSGAHAQCAAVFVNTMYAYDLKASNGWTIKATPEGKAYTRRDSNASVEYQVTFYKGADSKPFETMNGTYNLSSGYGPGAELSVSLNSAGSGAMGELMQVQKKMQDPQAFMKLSDKERDELIERMEALTEKMMQEQQAALSDPAAMQRKEDEFGCHHLALTTSADGAAVGTMSCGKNVGPLKLTGTAKTIK